MNWQPTDRFWSTVVVVVALATMVFVFWIALSSFKTSNDIVAGLGPVAGVVGTVVVAFFGINATSSAAQRSSDASQAAAQRVADASKMALDATSQTTQAAIEHSAQSFQKLTDQLAAMGGSPKQGEL